MADPKKAPSKKTYKNATIYPTIAGGVNAVLKESAKSDFYPIADFYKPTLVSKALEATRAGRVRVTTVQGSSIDIDRADLKKKLADNIKELKAFYEKQKSKPLAVTLYQRVTEETAEQFSKYFEYATWKPTDHENYKAEVNRHLINSDNKIVMQPAKVDVPTPINGYRLNDKAKLSRAVKNLRKPKLLEHKDVEIVASTEGNTIDGLRQLFTDTTELARACNIKDDGTRVLAIGNVEVSQTHLELLSVVSLTLANVLELNKDKKSRSVVNIKDAEKHGYIGRPSTTSFIDMVEGAVSGKELKKLEKTYRNKEEREAEGGFLAHIDDVQTALPFIYDDADHKTLVKFMAQSVTLSADAVLALQAFKRDNPDHSDYIKIKDLARYIKRYADDMETKGSLRPQYRKAILNGLTIAQLMGADYIVGKNPKTGATQWHRVYLINRITDYEKNKKGEIVAIKTDFTPEYKASLSHNVGVILDGVQNLKTPETKLLAVYISDRQVAQQSKTVKGEHITFTANTLCDKAGIIDQHVTKRYYTLSKMLDELVAEQVIGDWNTKANTKSITGYNKDSQTIYIKPTENVKTSYITKGQSKAERASEAIEQKNRVKALKQYAKGYTNLNTLADELELERQELDGLIAGQQPISDEVLAKIDLELAK